MVLVVFGAVSLLFRVLLGKKHVFFFFCLVVSCFISSFSSVCFSIFWELLMRVRHAPDQLRIGPNLLPLMRSTVRKKIFFFLFLSSVFVFRRNVCHRWRDGHFGRIQTWYRIIHVFLFFCVFFVSLSFLEKAFLRRRF